MATDIEEVWSVGVVGEAGFVVVVVVVIDLVAEIAFELANV
jgi:hypothetical protein